ncbi:MAG TPA: hypothetical protein VG815_01080 [Chloroflexota bacterium]|nr:hypothetical protein [Chloroflexota bacterium]
MRSGETLGRGRAYSAYALPGYRFSVQSDIPAVSSCLERVFGLFPRSGAASANYVITAAGFGFTVEADHAAALGFATLAETLEYVCWHASQTSLATVDDELAIHSAAVAADGRALLIAGASGAGKSTLTVELLRHGLSFLSDEAVFLSLNDGSVRGFPRAIALVGGAPPESVSDSPISLGAKAYHTPGEFGAGVVHDRLPVEAIILLHQLDQKPGLVSVNPLHALPFLLGQVFATGPAEVVLSAMTRLLSSTRVLSLKTDDPEAAAGEIAQLLEASDAA